MLHGPACREFVGGGDVTRERYQSRAGEHIDGTLLRLGLKAPDGMLYKVQSFEMKISGSPKSTLFKVLSSWLGKAPRMGWDYCELKGKGAVIKVEQVTSQMGKVYNKIASILPPKTNLSDYTSQVIPAEQFAVIQQASSAMQAPAPAPQSAPTPASAPPAWEPETDDEMDCPF